MAKPSEPISAPLPQVGQSFSQPWTISDVRPVCWLRDKEWRPGRAMLALQWNVEGLEMPFLRSWERLLDEYEWSETPQGPWHVCGIGPGAQHRSAARLAEQELNKRDAMNVQLMRSAFPPVVLNPDGSTHLLSEERLTNRQELAARFLAAELTKPIADIRRSVSGPNQMIELALGLADAFLRQSEMPAR